MVVVERKNPWMAVQEILHTLLLIVDVEEEMNNQAVEEEEKHNHHQMRQMHHVQLDILLVVDLAYNLDHVELHARVPYHLQNLQEVVSSPDVR